MLQKNITYVGVQDLQIDLFEGMYEVPEGVTYNSYIVNAEKIAVIDSVDSSFSEEWLQNISTALNGKSPAYLVVQHMEPDHSGSLKAFAEKYPDAVIVGNQKTFVMAEEYFGAGFPANRLVVKDGEELSLGDKTLKFIFAPMVHWPEVMFTYDNADKTLFTADAFGKFGNISEYDWACEARRYYFGIVGKYGVQVKGALAKLAGVNFSCVAPLHGPALSGEGLKEALRLYRLWSAYTPETDGTFIAYASVYGHTRKAAYALKDELEKRGEEVEIMDLSRDDWAECVEGAFEYSKLVVAATTYNADIFPAAREFLDRLAERNYQNRTVAFIENGTWAPVSAKLMRARLEGCKNLTFAENSVKIRSALSEENMSQICALAEELTK